MDELKIILNENIKYIIIAGIAYALDFLTGFTRALLRKDIQSSKLKKSISKFLLYFSLIVLGGCIEILFPSDTTVKIKLVCIAIFATDGWSVVENGKDIINIPFINDFFKKLVGGDKE